MPIRQPSEQAGRGSLSRREPWSLALVFASVVALVSGAGLYSPVAHAQSPDQLQFQGYVNDFAGVLSQSGRDQLTDLCTEVDQKAQAQIAIVTIRSLGDDTIEDYAVELFKHWGIGSKQTDRGLLILLAIDDHKDRYEVGYGLEGILPDGKVGSFTREAAPLLRDGKYDDAVLLMTRRAADVIAADRGVTLSGQPPPPAETEQGPREVSQSGDVLTILVIVIIFIILIRFIASLGGRSSSSGSRRGGGGWWVGPMIGGGWGGGGFGGGGWSGGGGGGGGGFGGFGGGSSGGGGASGSW